MIHLIQNETKKINMAGCVSVFQIMKLDNQFRNRSLPYHRHFKVLLIFVKPHIFVMYQVVFFFFCFLSKSTFISDQDHKINLDSIVTLA